MAVEETMGRPPIKGRAMTPTELQRRWRAKRDQRRRLEGAIAALAEHLRGMDEGKRRAILDRLARPLGFVVAVRAQTRRVTPEVKQEPRRERGNSLHIRT